MKIFLTELKIGDVRIEGPRIHANSWNEAEDQTKQIGVEIVGILKDEHIYYEPV